VEISTIPTSPDKVRFVELFAARLLTEHEPDLAKPPGRYDERLGLWVNESGLNVVNTLSAMPTRADRDRPGVLGTVTKAERDRDESLVQLGTTKTSAGRDKDRASITSAWLPPPDDVDVDRPA
jgi:hypothetical protein